jgi:cytochrome P450
VTVEPAAFPITRESPLEPPSVYGDFRLEGPLTRVRLWNGQEPWLVTHYADVRSVLLDKRFSESPRTPGYPLLSPARAALVEGDKLITQMQGGEHRRMRCVLSRELTVRRVEEQRQLARRLVHELIDEMVASGSPADIVKHLALQLPMRVISGMLGVPYEDHEFLEENRVRRVALDVAPYVPLDATREMAAYFDALLRKLEADPPSDDDRILARIARDHVERGAISHAEGVNLAYTMVQAGHETTANMIALRLLLLLRHPEQCALIQADKSLVKPAVEEMLRYTSILQLGMARVSTEDVEVGGQLVRKGEGLFAMLIAANHDPAAFPESDRFDVTRASRSHVAFSYGVHQCAGQQLARMEMQEVFAALFDRLPDLRLAVPFEELRFKHKNIVFGVEALPVAW